MISLNNKGIWMQAKFRRHILHQFNGYNSMVGIEKKIILLLQTVYTLRYGVTMQWWIFPRLSDYWTSAFHNHILREKSKRQKNIQNPQDRKNFLLISSINQHQIPNWNHWSCEDIFNDVVLHQSLLWSII